ncbi:MAG: hypothetical protein ACK2UB_11920 [Anaerolineales bacterium]
MGVGAGGWVCVGMGDAVGVAVFGGMVVAADGFSPAEHPATIIPATRNSHPGILTADRRREAGRFFFWLVP